jgi:hypothetical protein
MIPVRIVPLFGASTVGKSAVVTVQRRLNCYFELRKDADKTKVACYGTPGLVAAFTLSGSPGGLPVRGWVGTQSSLYIVAYNTFTPYNSNGTALAASASIGTTSGNVSLAVSGNQVVIVDGSSAYLYNISGASISTIGSFPATGAKTVTFVAGFFVAEQPGTQTFCVSNANDGSTWNALAFASASQYSDNIVAVDNLSGNLITFSQQHTEFWQNAGLTPEPFTPILSAASEYGLAAIFSRAHVAESICFLAQNREGQYQVCQIQGLGVRVISDPDIDALINGLGTVSDAVGMTRGTDTHKFYQLNFPTANRSLLYDTHSGLWCDVQTGASISPVRHQANLSAYCNGQLFYSDYQTNQIYSMSPSAYTDNGAVIAREVDTRHVFSDFNRVRISALYIDMETGVGLQSGQGSNPKIMLQYSKDNGRTWSAERWVSLGMVGQYLTRVIWRRFGSTRDATWRIRMTDPVKFVITEGAIRMRQKRAA